MGQPASQHSTLARSLHLRPPHSLSQMAFVRIRLHCSPPSPVSASPPIMSARRLASAVRASYRLMRAHRPLHTQCLAAGVGLASAEAALPARPAAAASPAPSAALSGHPVDSGVDSHLRVMARYHTWACRKLLAAVSDLSDEEYRRDVGLAFRSVHGTLVHMLAADEVWAARLARGDVAGVEHLWAADTSDPRWEQHVHSRDEVAARLIQGCEVGDMHTARGLCSSSGSNSSCSCGASARADPHAGGWTLITPASACV